MREATGKVLLEALAGPFMLSLADPHALPDDARLTVLLAKKAMSSWRRGRGGSTSSRDNAAPQGRLRQPARTYATIGGLLRQYLGAFFYQVHARLTEDAQQLQDFNMQLRTPFETTGEVEARQRETQRVIAESEAVRDSLRQPHNP